MQPVCAQRAQSSSAKCAIYAHDQSPNLVHDRHMDVDWFREQKKRAGVSDGALAEALGVERSVANKVANGKVGFNARRADAVAKLLDVSRDELLFRVGVAAEPPRVEAGPSSRSPDQPSIRSVDGGETVPILRLDLSYSMGPGTSLDDSYIESEPINFDLGFLRTITITPPDRIRIVDGIGDSMQPTIHDRDLLFIDTNQRDLNAQDRIWALWLFGLGAVKRLRAVGPDRVLVISDNPDIENQEVSRKDIMIHGRVVGSIKRI